MGLITKEVEVILSGKNIPHYRALEYEIPKVYKNWRWSTPQGTKILVKVEDLPTGSDDLVTVSCDLCGKIYELKYKDYVKSLKNGKKYCHSCTLKLFNSGENAPNYNPNLTDKEREIGRNYPEYTEFVKKVLARDNHICQCCGKQVNHDAEVHHLDGYNWCIEKRTDDTNGITLCSMCHKAFHNWHRNKYGIKNNGDCTKEQYENWIGYAIGELEKYDGKLPTTRQIYCYEENKIYDSCLQYAISHNVSIESVNQVCNRNNSWSLKGIHLFWYDEYSCMKINQIEDIVNHHDKSWTKAICTTTGKIFNSLAEGAREYKINATSSISNNCRGITKSAGKLPDGTPLRWMYYEDYLSLN